MPLTYSLKTATDLFQKLIRDSDLLNKEVSGDNLFNFLITSYSLFDWIKNNPSYSAAMKLAAEELRKNQYLEICRDLANASKHFKLDKRNSLSAVVKDTTSSQGYGVGRYGAGSYGVGEEHIIITLNDGTEMDVLILMSEILGEWRNYFLNQKLI